MGVVRPDEHGVEFAGQGQIGEVLPTPGQEPGVFGAQRPCSQNGTRLPHLGISHPLEPTGRRRRGQTPGVIGTGGIDLPDSQQRLATLDARI